MVQVILISDTNHGCSPERKTMEAIGKMVIANLLSYGLVELFKFIGRLIKKAIRHH